MTEGGDDETLQDLHDLVGAVAAAEGSAKHSAQRSVLTAVEKVAKWFADGEEHAMVVPIRRRYGCLYILLVYCLASPPHPSLPLSLGCVHLTMMAAAVTVVYIIYFLFPHCDNI